MSGDLFWLSDEQFAKVEPLLPSDTRGKVRVDDRRVISGIIHVLKSAAAGSTRRSTTAPGRPSTTALCDGRTRACGFACSRRWRSLAVRRCS